MTTLELGHEKAKYEEIAIKEYYRRRDIEWAKPVKDVEPILFASHTPFGLLVMSDPMGCCSTDSFDMVWIDYSKFIILN